MISAAKKLARLLLASAAAAGFVAPAVSAPLSADPNVRQLSNRKNYEPGGKYFLFGNARGGVQKRNGKINIRTSPPVAAGNMETETVYFGGLTKPPPATEKEKAQGLPTASAQPTTYTASRQQKCIPPTATTARRAEISRRPKARAIFTAIRSAAPHPAAEW